MEKNAIEFDKEQFLKAAKDAALQKVAAFNMMSQPKYPSPLLSLADTDTPNNVSDTFKWCRYFYTFDPLITGAVNALATFPVTEIYIEDKAQAGKKGKSDQQRRYERVLFSTLKIHKMLVEIGIDYWLYGNCFVFGEMHNPHHKGPVTPEVAESPEYKAGLEWKHLIRLDPNKMTIDVDPITFEKVYKWEVPEQLRRIVKNKKPEKLYAKIPDVIKQAVTENKVVVLRSDHVYHFARPSASGEGSAWGTPVVLNVFKLLMYRNLLRRSQEAIAQEHIVPFRVYYLQPNEMFSAQVNWSATAGALAQQLQMSSQDPNYKVVSPVPVGVLNLGGQGRALLLTPEIEQIQAEILAGMNVPREFIFGGVSYSGSNVSLRIVENNFITYRLLLKDFLNNFIIKKMAIARGEWNAEDEESDDANIVEVQFSDLKMLDDVQQKQIILNLNAAGKLPDDYVYNMLGFDPDKVKKELEREAKEKIEFQTKVQIWQLEASAKIQLKQLEIQAKTAIKQRELEAQTGMVQDPTTGEFGGPPAAVFADQMQQPSGAGEAQSQPSTPKASGTWAQGGQGVSSISASSKAPGGTGNQPPVAKEPTTHLSAQDMHNMAYATAKELMGQPEEVRAQLLAKLPVSIQLLTKEYLNQIMGQDGLEESVDMRPLPTQKPPRRKTLGGAG